MLQRPARGSAWAYRRPHRTRCTNLRRCILAMSATVRERVSREYETREVREIRSPAFTPSLESSCETSASGGGASAWHPRARALPSATRSHRGSNHRAAQTTRLTHRPPHPSSTTSFAQSPAAILLLTAKSPPISATKNDKTTGTSTEARALKERVHYASFGMRARTSAGTPARAATLGP